jgi:hypothetical protein
MNGVFVACNMVAVCAFYSFGDRFFNNPFCGFTSGVNGAFCDRKRLTLVG